MAETAGNTVLEITRQYEAAPERVWQAWTDPQALSRWFGPGGRYTIAFNTPDGEAHRVSGEYTEVVPPRKLSFSWAWQSTPERVSFITIEMQPCGDGTTMRFRHERFFDETARNNHLRGWTATFAKLDALLGRRA
jgi:uncharacterized protein YndB with AHSA1/START domain